MLTSERLYYSDSFLRPFTGAVTDVRELARSQDDSVWQVALDRTAEYDRESSELRKAIELGLLSKAIYSSALRFLRRKYIGKYENELRMRRKGRLRKKN